MGLYHRRIAVNIHDESGQSVAFAVHETITVRHRIPDKPDGPTHPDSGTQPLQPPPGVNLRLHESQYPHRDGTYLIMAPGKELPLPRIDIHHIAFGGLPLHPFDGSRKDPRVATAE